MYSQEIYTHVHIIILMTKYITEGDNVNNGKRCVKKIIYQFTHSKWI